ncbi:MAG TPA: hypothetical protein VKA46_33585 [Gemmataceae bacterium]|nr:hypothetical protein [Gemmataceae bacterium]
MTLEELKEALRAADPAAVLVPGHLLARVIREVTDLPAQVIHVPHRKSFILDRAVLLRHAELDDLDLGPERMLPSKVILLARPNPDRRNTLERQTTLLKYWRRLFHANVHLHLERLAADKCLGPDEVAARVERIGATAFDEARAVLDQEGYLFPRATARDVYIEFAAVYLEFRYFLPELLPVYFPAIRDHHRVEEVLAADVDAETLFERTRLAGVSGPAPRPDDSTDEPSEACVQLIREAKKASRAGNNVRAAILRTRAAHIAPAALTVRLQQEVVADLEQLTDRLGEALKLTDEERAEWRKDLPALLDKTGEGQWSAEARLLYDLQSACVDHEREVYALDLVEWALSAGKRPIKRPLSGQRVVRITRHLHSAAQRLSSTRLSETDRRHLGHLLHEALRANEERLRARFRPVLAETLHDVGLVAAPNAPEEAASAKLVEELLDRISEVGFFTFSDLRDALSRNNLKLPDLVDPVELVRGDPLLRMDRLLASSPLDGVYRPSEVYLRLMQRLTAPNFGTGLGRLVTRYVTLPFGTALLVLEGIDLLRREVWCRVHGTVYQPLFGPISVLFAQLLPPHEPAAAEGAPAAAGDIGPPLLPLLAPSLWLLLGLLALGLLYVPGLRRAFVGAGRWASRAGRRVFVEWPLRALPWPAVRRFLKSWAFQLCYGLVIKPLPVYLLLSWLFREVFDTWGWGPRILLFFVVVLVLNSRPGRGLEEAGSRGLVQSLTWLRAGLVDGLLRLIIEVFKAITDGVEYVLYTVDEWLRFRGGDSRLSMIVRAVLGVVWFPVSYVTRLYIVVLVEPGFNPLKAPISLLAAKFVYPIILALELKERLPPMLEPLVGSSVVAKALAWSTLWLLPDAFGFLFWEMKENWKLYRANRPATLEPAAIGPYGETLLRLLKPGFHSGTLPKLFAQLRKAERDAHETGAWRAARAVRERLRTVEVSLRRFVARDVLALLHLSPEWKKKPLSVGAVDLASNQVRFELRHADYPATPLRLAIAEQDGLLVADVEEPGWLSRLTPPETRTLDQAIAGMYKLAGVDLVRRPVEAPAEPVPPVADEVPEHCTRRPLPAASANGSADGQAIVFGGVTIPWAQWVDWWHRDRLGEPPPPPVSVLPPAPAE